MNAFWDVLWSDTKATAILLGPMLLLTVPGSGLGALLGVCVLGRGSWNRVGLKVARGVVLGTAVALVVSMLLEFSLKTEGLPLVRRAFSDQTMLPLILAAPAVGFLVTFLAMRPHPSGTSNQPRRYRFTIRQLFVGQLVLGLLLGWWTYTRREEIGHRKVDLEWQTREEAAKAVFDPYGWYVKSWRDKIEIALWHVDAFGQQPVSDATLDLVVQHGNVIELNILSDRVSDEGLERLRAAKGLNCLVVTSNQITDAGLHAVSMIPGLETLWVTSPNITLDGLKCFPMTTSLKSIVIQGIAVTPDEYRELLSSRPDLNLSVPVN